MIAKITRSGNLFGTLAYNNLKIKKETGTILLTNNIIENVSGKYSVAQLSKSFEPYLLANRNTEKHTVHISLNPDPNDRINDDQFVRIAQKYMQEMGFSEQPYIVFKHTDIERSHIHIVTVCIDDQGRKISDKFEKMRSMKVCRDLEKEFELINATSKAYKKNDKIFSPIDYQQNDVKSQIASVVRHLPNYYQYQTLGEYNALLSLFNIRVEKVEGELNGNMRQGLLYVPLNEKGERAGHAFKASLFGKSSGLAALDLYFTKCKESLKNHSTKSKLTATISNAMKHSSDEQTFKEQLKGQAIDVVIRRNNTDRIYGITFIDHNSKIVWNGSRLSKALSANVFNDYWNQNIPSIVNEINEPKTSPSYAMEDATTATSHHLFEFLNTFEKYEDSLFGTLGGLLPESLSEDYEELDFANRIKKKKLKKKR